jgi:ureidoacrylate peracid hydrolase
VLEPLRDRVNPATTALLVIDVQNDFCGGGLGEKIRPHLRKLVDAARESGAFRVFIRAHYDPQYLNPPFAERLTVLGRIGKICQEGTPGADWWEGFAPAPSAREIVVSKHRYSAFRGTGLAETLRAAGVRTVIATGVTTGTCVDSTVRDAFFEDFFVVLSSDATAEFDDDVQRERVAQLGRVFAHAAPSDEIAEAMRQGPSR